jgi:RNA polymerase sigma-70 factor (ECF subfamily)
MIGARVNRSIPSFVGTGVQRDTVVVTVTGGAFDVGEPGEPIATEPDSEFEQIYRAEYARLVAIARTYLPGREAAHDAVQEAFVRLFRNWPEVRHHDVPGAWARRVLVNLCIDITRRSKREAAANQRVETMPRPDGPAVDLGSDARPDADLLRRATAELPDLQRAVVALHYVDELSVAEIAEVLDVHVGTVKTSLFRARRRLAKIMEEQS